MWRSRGNPGGINIDKAPKKSAYISPLKWIVRINKRTEKNVLKLPERVKKALALLLLDMEQNGPIRGNWPNYGKLAEHRHHCHLKKGHPTYVAVWEDSSNGLQLIEITYAGTHERAPY